MPSTFQHPSSLGHRSIGLGRLNEELRLPPRYIALQVRRGDKVAGNRKDHHPGGPQVQVFQASSHQVDGTRFRKRRALDKASYS